MNPYGTSDITAVCSESVTSPTYNQCTVCVVKYIDVLCISE